MESTRQGGDMLIEHRPFYQFSMFLPSGVIGTPEWVTKLSPDFAVLEMMPSLISHPNIYLGLGEQPANLQQLHFVTARKDLSLIFDTDRYIFQMNIIPARELPPVDDFIKKVEEIVKIVYRYVTVKASRMSFVTAGLCKKMDTVKLNEIHKKLFKLPDEFSQNEVVEWESRQVCRATGSINGRNELLNMILNINRIQITHHFEHKPVSYDGIEIGVDVNTYQGNPEQRFSTEDVKPFLHEAIKIKNSLEASLLSIIGG
jgi:hypothetical protein